VAKDPKATPEQVKQAEAWQEQIDEIVSGKAKNAPPKNLKEFIDQAAAKKKRPSKKST
jgi:hypothetical protein